MTAIVKKSEEPWDSDWGHGTPWGILSTESGQDYALFQRWLDWQGTPRDFARHVGLPLGQVLGLCARNHWDARRRRYAAFLGEEAHAERVEAARRAGRSAGALLRDALDIIGQSIDLAVSNPKALSAKDAIALLPKILEAKALDEGKPTANVAIDFEKLTPEALEALGQVADQVRVR